MSVSSRSTREMIRLALRRDRRRAVVAARSPAAARPSAVRTTSASASSPLRRPRGSCSRPTPAAALEVTRIGRAPRRLTVSVARPGTVVTYSTHPRRSPLNVAPVSAASGRSEPGGTMMRTTGPESVSAIEEVCSLPSRR